MKIGAQVSIKATNGGPIYGKAVRRLMKRLPHVVSAAQAHYDAVNNANFKKLFGKSLPLSTQEAEAAVVTAVQSRR